MENKSFTTETDAKYAKMQFFRPVLITMIGTMALSLLGLIVSPGLVVMLEKIGRAHV